MPLLFSIFFAAVINAASARFKVDKGIMDASVHLRKKRRAGRRGEATAGESVLATPLWGMIYADDAGVVSQSPKQGCVLMPLLFNIFFVAVINMVSTRSKADKGVMDALVHLRKKRGAGRREEATVGESILATPLWGMLYARDARVVSQSPEQLRKMMRVIVVV